MKRAPKGGPRELFSQHLNALREYGAKTLQRCESLTLEDEADISYRMREYFAIGSSFGLTEKELVLLLCKGLLARRPLCGCPSCRARHRANPSRDLPWPHD